MLGGVGGTEIILIILVIIIFFGADKIPELARGLGQGMSEFRKASDSIKKEIDNSKKNFSAPPKREKANTEVKEEVIDDEKKAPDENKIERNKSKNS